MQKVKPRIPNRPPLKPPSIPNSVKVPDKVPVSVSKFKRPPLRPSFTRTKPGAAKAVRKAAEAAARRQALKQGLTKVARPGGALAVRRAATSAATKSASRFVPVVGYALLALDILDFALWAAGYKDLQKSVGDPTRFPTLEGPPPFTGGQATTDYLITFRRIMTSGTENVFESGTKFRGPISGGQMDVFTNNCPNDRYNYDVLHNGTSTRQLTNGSHIFYQFNNCSLPFGSVGSMAIVSVRRNDGLPDIDGNPPGELTENPIYENPAVNPPRQLPGSGVPDVFSPPSNPLVSPEVLPPFNPSTNPGRLPIYDPDFDPVTNPTPSPNPNATTTTVPEPTVTNTKPRVSRPQSGSCDAATNPCGDSTFRFLEYLDDRLDRDKEEQKERDERPPKTQVIDFPFIQCTEEGPVIQTGRIEYVSSNPSDLLGTLTEQANLAYKGCELGDSVLAVPDIWNVRKTVQCPVLVLVFRRGTTRTYHSYSLPYPENTSPPTDPPIGEFQKGNWYVSLELFDNSKSVFNCGSRAEAERVISEAESAIDTAVLAQGKNIRFTERLGQPILQESMRPVRAMFFPDGNQTLKPEWRVSFTSSL